MSQIPDIAPSTMKPIGSQPVKPARKPPTDVAVMNDGDLADEHRGQTFAKMRAADRLKEIEAELDRRNLDSARGKVAAVSRQLGDIGLMDLKRLRLDLGDAICREYAVPGSDRFWLSRTLSGEERSA